jgi:5-bromo-4-chloroindolyl phosphate hydrolysis protein
LFVGYGVPVTAQGVGSDLDDAVTKIVRIDKHLRIKVFLLLFLQKKKILSTASGRVFVPITQNPAQVIRQSNKA